MTVKVWDQCHNQYIYITKKANLPATNIARKRKASLDC